MQFQLDDNQSQIFRRLQIQIKEHTTQISSVQTQLAIKERESKKNKIVSSEIKSLVAQQPSINLYESFGKSFILEDHKKILKNYNQQEREVAEDSAALTKKLKFLEKELKNSQASLDDFLKQLGIK